jgi:2'-5' RNA ligase
MIRAFLAIPVPKPARDALAVQQQMIPTGRLTNPDSFHITLAYLDKQTPLMLERVHVSMPK